MNLRSFHYTWEGIRSLHSALEPARVSLILAIVAPVLFLLVPQGVDVLNALGERDKFDGWFFFALTIFGLMNWFGPRFLLDCDFGEECQKKDLECRFIDNPGALARYEKIEKWLGLHLPRLLGTVPIAVIGFGFLNLWLHHLKFDSKPSWGHALLAGCCFALALSLYLFFVGRRFLLRRYRVRKNLGTPARYKNVREIARDRLALMGFTLFLLPALVLGVLFTFMPVPVGLDLGPGAVLVFALASWSCYGAITIYFGHRVGLPTLTLGALLMVVASFFNDNHSVRSLKGSGDQRSTLTSRLQAWHDHVNANYSGRHPLFIVVTEGGGIRAGYWTALVLATLEHRAQGRFSDHVFAISGVSGGSLGAATFTTLLGSPFDKEPAVRVKAALGAPFLAPLVGKMAFPDLWQRFLPWRFEALDRARALEAGWESTMPLFEAPFSKFCETAAWSRPELFFNGTQVESGRRIVTGTARFEKNETDAIDGVSEMEGMDMRLSTAVHASARFTYFSPAGRYPDGTHVVDGGYFENSGASTAHDILRAIWRQRWEDVDPLVIVITNGPERINSEPVDDSAQRCSHAGHELLAPLTALLGTRTAHANQAADDLRAALLAENVFSFGLIERSTAIPLGWALSEGAMKEMEFQVDAAADLKKPDGDLKDSEALMKNSRALAQVIGRLPAARSKK